MYHELIVNTGLEQHKVFLQDGFYTPHLVLQPPHKHNYTEIHIATGENVLFHIGDRLQSSAIGNLVVIPPDVFHNVECSDPNALHTAFQIDFEISSVTSRKISDQTVVDFINEIKRCQKTGNYASVATYISLFCNNLYPKELHVRPVRDYKFLICEFFFKRYNEDLHLSDLAAELHLSERQAERLVIQTTGRTFRQELATVRIHAAKHLLKATELPMEEVAHHVGYRSYAGFWKAMKKYGD